MNLAEECRASPAIANGRIYLRGDKHLLLHPRRRNHE